MATNKTKILIVNGPNVNMLGLREPETYGAHTYDELLRLIEDGAKRLDCECDVAQHNAEGDMVTAIQQARGTYDYIILNAAAYTHTSVAVRDAVLASGVKMIEVHISNVYKRETFRHKSYLSDIAECVICGAGLQGYVFAMEYAGRR